MVGTLFGKVLDRSGARAETIRSGYADATKALNAWGQFPLRIRRRVDDRPETLMRLEQMGAEIQGALAYATGWFGAESPELGAVYNRLVELLRAEVALHARLAWSTPAKQSPGAMNIAAHTEGDAEVPSGTVPAERLVVQLFSSLIL